MIKPYIVLYCQVGRGATIDKMIKIASWNIEGRLSDTGDVGRGTPAHILNSIAKLDADVLLLAEAHSADSLDDLPAGKQLRDLGYQIHSVNYDDDTAERTDSYNKKLSLVFASRLPINKFQVIRLGDLRNALVAIVGGIRFIGIHLDDRREETRVRQMHDLVKTINKSDMPTIVMGDFNAMHGGDLWPARFLRLRPVRFLARFAFVHIAKRAVEMARGEAISYLENNTNLTDADSQHRPTTTPKVRGFGWLPSVRLIQIDHIFISPDVKISDFTISPDLGADHRAITLEITNN